MVRLQRSQGKFVWWLALLALIAASPLARAAITAEEARLLERLDSKRTLAEIRRLSQQVVTAPSALGAGTVVSGSPEEEALAKDIAASLRDLGLDVNVEEFPVRAYRYGPIKLTANGVSIPAISLHAAGGTWGTRDTVPYARGTEAGGHRLHATLVDAADGYAPDYARVGDVRGKVVLVRRELRDWPPAQITEAAQRGAAAILFYGHPSSAEQPDALRQDSMWGHDQIPAAAISHRSGESLRKEIASRVVDITLENSVSVADGRSRNVVGMLRGTDLPDEWVMVSAHYDRWFQGALDNTSGAAAVVEIARAVTGSGLKPRRSMLFVTTGSEEAGQEDPERDWLAGSYAFVERHPEVLRNAALIANIDMIGWTAPSGKLGASADVLADQKNVLADLGYERELALKVPAGAVTDAWNYGVVGGAAVIHLDRVTPAYYPIYHTQVDVALAEYFANLQPDLRVLTLSLWRAANVQRLPISLTGLADYIDAQLALDAAKAPDVPFAEVRGALADFRKAAAEVEGVSDAAARDAVNRLLMTTRHAVVPWLYACDADYDQSVRTTEYANRVALYDRVIAAVRSGDRPGATKALGDLYEGRQCLRLTPAVYQVERAFWAGEGGWASRFGQRAPPPPPPFESACAALGQMGAEPAALVAMFTAVRADAAESVAQATALMAAKLRLATIALQQYSRQQAH